MTSTQTAKFTITDVDIKLPSGGQKRSFLAWASIIIGGCFKVRGLRLVELDNGRIHLAFPDMLLNHQMIEISVAHPLTVEAREYCTRCVIWAYRKKLREIGRCNGDGIAVGDKEYIRDHSGEY